MDGFSSQSHAPAIKMIEMLRVASFNVPFWQVRAIPHARSDLSFIRRSNRVFLFERRKFYTQQFAVWSTLYLSNFIKIYHCFPIQNMPTLIHFGTPATLWKPHITCHGLDERLRKPCWKDSVTSKMGWSLGSPSPLQPGGFLETAFEQPRKRYTPKRPQKVWG